MEEVTTLGLQNSQEHALLQKLRAKLASPGAPGAPPPVAPPAVSSVTHFPPTATNQRQNYEAFTNYLPASVRIWKPINHVARGLECRVPRHRIVASDLAFLRPFEKVVNRFPCRGVGAHAARGQRPVLQVPHTVGLDFSFGAHQAGPGYGDPRRDVHSGRGVANGSE